MTYEDNAINSYKRQLLWTAAVIFVSVLTAVTFSTLLVKSLIKSEVGAATSNQPAPVVQVIPASSSDDSLATCPAPGLGAGGAGSSVPAPSSTSTVHHKVGVGGFGSDIPAGGMVVKKIIEDSFNESHIINTTNTTATTIYTNSNNVTTIGSHNIENHKKTVKYINSFNNDSFNKTVTTTNTNSFNKNSFNTKNSHNKTTTNTTKNVTIDKSHDKTINKTKNIVNSYNKIKGSKVNMNAVVQNSNVQKSEDVSVKQKAVALSK